MKPIYLTIQPARQFAFALGLISLLFLSSLWLLRITLVLKIAIIILAIFIVIFLIKKTLFNTLKFEVNHKGVLHQWVSEDKKIEATVLGSSYVEPWLTILHYRLETSKRHQYLVLIPDRLDQDSFRRFRVYLRWAKKPDKVDSVDAFENSA